jgi:hypothetical protein
MGKALIARAIDYLGSRAGKPFVTRKESQNRGKFFHPNEWGKPDSLGMMAEGAAPQPGEFEEALSKGNIQSPAAKSWAKTDKLIADNEKRVQERAENQKQRRAEGLRRIEQEMKKTKTLVVETLEGITSKNK